MHLAALAHDSAGSPEQIMAVNVLGTWNVLLAAEAAGADRVISFSSAQVFGIAEGERLPDYFPVDDAHPRRAMRPYGLSKKLAEDLCAGFTARTAIPTMSLRPVAVWDEARYAPAPGPAARAAELIAVGAVLGVRRVRGRPRRRRCRPPGTDGSAGRAPPGAAVRGRHRRNRRRPSAWPPGSPPAVPVADPGRYGADPWAALIDCSAAATALGWQAAHRWSQHGNNRHSQP